MSRKNIILMLICGICGFFVFKNFYKLLNPGHITFDLEVAKCDAIGEWLKKKNIEETALYGFSDTLTTRLDKFGIKVNNSITIAPPPPPSHDNPMAPGTPPRDQSPTGPSNPGTPPIPLMPGGPGSPQPLGTDPKINQYFDQVKKSKLKSIIFVDGLRPTDSIEELKTFLKSGGYVYFRDYANELNDNEPLHQYILEYMKKGQVCIVLVKYPETDVRKLSMKNRILAENNFIDDNNFAEFDNWHKEMVKRKAEFLKPPPQKLP